VVENEQQLRVVADRKGFSENFYDDIDSMIINANLSVKGGQ